MANDEEMKISGVWFLDKECERCKNGHSLMCSEACSKVPHDHECPDCERMFSVDKII